MENGLNSFKQQQKQGIFLFIYLYHTSVESRLTVASFLFSTGETPMRFLQGDPHDL